MDVTRIIVGLMVATGSGMAAMAQESLYVPLLTYRTGPFAGSGIPIAN
jgi:branched-chain amino acid transport system substrate-binding protein